MITSLLSPLAVLLYCAAFLTAVEARPHRRVPRPDGPRERTLLSAYIVPLSNGSVTLPVPSSSSALKAIALGRGTQNYTCANSTSIPVAIGAVATMFDVSPLLLFLPPTEGQEILNLLPSYLVSLPTAILKASSLPELGLHTFSNPTTPVFDLSSAGIGVFHGQKAGAVTAPAGSSKGANGKGNGAVDWLRLTAVAGSKGISEVYRTYTAGGKAPATCQGQGKTIQVEYAAQYWFYG